MTLDLHTNPTQIAGLLAYACSTLACVLALRRSGRATWLALSVVHGLLWLDILLNMRHRAHDAVNAVLRSLGLYERRVPAQWLMLMLLAALAWWAWRMRARAGAAALATAMLLALTVVEMISWHYSDELLYTQFGPLLLVAYGWIGGTAVVTWAALRR